MTDAKAETLTRAKLVIDGLFNFGPGLTEHDRIVFIAGVIEQAREEGRAMTTESPIPMILHCPECGYRHIDRGAFATKLHHTHACQTCGMVWRPAIVPTVGVQFLPGFKDAEIAREKETP